MAKEQKSKNESNWDKNIKFYLSDYQQYNNKRH
jgi:hypothetical protein